MGAKYHLLHHTHYHYNFGQVRQLQMCFSCVALTTVPFVVSDAAQFFTFCDYIFGSLKEPAKSKFD